MAALVLGFAFGAISGSGTSPVTSVASVVFSPLQKLSARLAEAMSDFKAGFVSADYYRKQIDELKLQIEDYKEQLVDYEKQKRKLSSYEEMLGVKDEHKDFKLSAAEIISRDPSDSFFSFVIDKGSLNGIETEMPVIFGKQLIGVVKEVTPTTALVKTILSPEVNVGAYEIRTFEDGYTKGLVRDGKSGQMEMSGLTSFSAISKGGLVCTSGVGGLYPRDLIIGSVKEIYTDNITTAGAAVLEPEMDFSSLTDVFVITDFSGRQK
jgi:rod shape-determining protein MreC